MTSLQKKSIFWFEDDAHSLTIYIEELRKKYELRIGAHLELIKQTPPRPFDLLLLDLMIHNISLDFEEFKEVYNINYKDIHWTQTGVEFLRLLRKGKYESYGFSSSIPVIVATALVDNSIKENVGELGVNDFLIKPYTLDKLEASINKIFKQAND